MAKKSESTALVPFSGNQLPALQPGALDIIKANLDGEELTPADLPRIKVPSGSGSLTSWLVVTGGKEDHVTELDGIIIHSTRRRAFWSSPDPSGDPPECSSEDCINGTGNPGGPCGTNKSPLCPHNHYGTSTKADGKPGRGKACTENRLLFFLRTGQTLPDVVPITPGSLKVAKAYILSLSQAGIPYRSVVTRLKLTETKNADGVKYAEVVFEKLDSLDAETTAKILEYAQTMQGLFQSVGVEPTTSAE